MNQDLQKWMAPFTMDWWKPSAGNLWSFIRPKKDTCPHFWLPKSSYESTKGSFVIDDIGTKSNSTKYKKLGRYMCNRLWFHPRQIRMHYSFPMSHVFPENAVQCNRLHSIFGRHFHLVKWKNLPLTCFVIICRYTNAFEPVYSDERSIYTSSHAVECVWICVMSWKASPSHQK